MALFIRTIGIAGATTKIGMAKRGRLWLNDGSCSPWENGFIETFNARLLDGLLNGEIFYTLK